MFDTSKAKKRRVYSGIVDNNLVNKGPCMAGVAETGKFLFAGEIPCKEKLFGSSWKGSLVDKFSQPYNFRNCPQNNYAIFGTPIQTTAYNTTMTNPPNYHQSLGNSLASMKSSAQNWSSKDSDLKFHNALSQIYYQQNIPMRIANKYMYDMNTFHTVTPTNYSWYDQTNNQQSAVVNDNELPGTAEIIKKKSNRTSSVQSKLKTKVKRENKPACQFKQVSSAKENIEATSDKSCSTKIIEKHSSNDRLLTEKLNFSPDISPSNLTDNVDSDSEDDMSICDKNFSEISRKFWQGGFLITDSPLSAACKIYV